MNDEEREVEREETRQKILKVQLDENRRLNKLELMLKTTRAGKLLLKKKPFIVVADDEPYYMDVYKMIRKHESTKGTWTEHCEVTFRLALEKWLGLIG